MRALVALMVLCVAGLVVAPAAVGAPQLGSTTYWSPTHLAPGGHGRVWVQFRNSGPEPALAPWTVRVDLPDGVTYAGVTPGGSWSDPWGGSGFCAATAPGESRVVCTSTVSLPAYSASVGFGTGGSFDGFTQVMFNIDVDAGAAQGAAPLRVRVSGGGSDTAVEERAVEIDSTPAPFGLHDVEAGAFDAAGGAFGLAGGHPDRYRTFFRSNIDELFGGSLGQANVVPAGDGPRKLHVQTPPGFVGDPFAVPRCAQQSFLAHPEVDGEPRCPYESQVGYAIVNVPILGAIRAAIYNLRPPPHLAAQLGFMTPAGPVNLNPRVRANGDFGLTATVASISQADVMLASEVVLWGEPSSPDNDDQRCPALNIPARACVGVQENGIPQPENVPHPFDGPRRAFLSMPTNCTQQQRTSFVMDRWDAPAPAGDLTDPRWQWFQTTGPAMDGCAGLAFDPTLDLEATGRRADAPTGLAAHLHIPREGDKAPDGRVQSHLRKATVTLPPGLVLNPSAADGLQACSPAQIGLQTAPGELPYRFDEVEPTCPRGSKIANATVTSPLLEVDLAGEVFVATPDANPFASTYAVYVVVREPSILVKLAGKVIPDPKTGQLTSVFDDGPQLPFSDFRLRFFDGPKASLTAPPACATHTAGYRMDGWSGASVDATDALAVDQGCAARGFDPDFDAGSIDPAAGSFSAFVARIRHGKPNQPDLDAVDITMPRGALANLRHVQPCTDGDLAAAATRTGRAAQHSGGCPLGSQIGTVTTGAGSGELFYPRLPGTNVSGRVYLTARHEGARPGPPDAAQTAYGIAVEVPAIAGPFDLGTVIVRAALYLHPRTGQATVVSDPMPSILDGTPLDVRDVRIHIDRPNFTTTPTSCAPKQVAGHIHAQDNTTATRAARYRVGQCADLRFRPRLALRLAGRRQMRTNGHPTVRARVRQSGIGEAAIGKARVALPKTLALDPANAQALCEFEDGTRSDLEHHCPAGSIVGKARALSPLLKQPLTGDVYFVKNIRIDKRTGNPIRTLPMIVAALRGEAAINLYGNSSTTKNGKLVNTFAQVPDAPVGRFNLNIAGGANGILTVTRTPRSTINLCNRPRQRAQTGWKAHNGKLHRRAVSIKTPCAKQKNRKPAGRRRR